MSLQPIDLQTLFVRLSTIGREQSALKQAVAQNQAVTGSEIAQKSQNAGNTVREADEVSEGPETVNEEGQQGSPERHNMAEGENKGDEDSSDVEGEFRDPDLGQNIDLTG